MIGSLGSDESGVALGLAVIVVVLLGVLAAGLLAVVRGDLEGTVQTNRGQQALHLADAGAQAAAAQLHADATPGHYDADGADKSARPTSRPTVARLGRRLPRARAPRR